MVRIKATGEVTEVERTVMQVLRSEEKRFRRAMSLDQEADRDGISKPTILSLDVLPEDVEPELEPLSELELLTVPELGLLLDVLPDELFTVPDDGLLLDVLPDELLTVPDDGLLLDELLLDDDFLLELLELDLSDLLDLLELDLLELLELLELDFVAAFVSINEKLKL